MNIDSKVRENSEPLREVSDNSSHPGLDSMNQLQANKGSAASQDSEMPYQPAEEQKEVINDRHDDAEINYHINGSGDSAGTAGPSPNKV